MLPRPYRLPAPEILHVLRFGKKTADEVISVTLKPNQKTNSRWAILISKKIVKKAAKRNRLRRVFKAAIIELIPQVGAYDVVVRLKKPIPSVTSKYARQMLEKVLKTIVK